MNIAIRILAEIIRRDQPKELKVHPGLLKHLPAKTWYSEYVELDVNSVYYAPKLRFLAVNVSPGGNHYHYTKIVT